MSAEASNHDRAEKLIGGWVAGTLTKEERKLLLDASLSNQALFDALADEEGMRELLADPTVRRQLSALLASSSQPVAAAPASLETWWRWLFRPAPIAAFSAGVLAVLAFVVVRPAFIEKPAPSVAAVVLPARRKQWTWRRLLLLLRRKNRGIAWPPCARMNFAETRRPQ